ncbi:uncharacterized protein [Miscanthus floridulus]|uniref:uncharacterized protein n=1 Tax=Miscanthus floridulus TaxID=154761 RepID=UPI00345898FA
MLNPSSSRRPPMPPPTPSSSESDLEVNLEDDPNRETASEEEPEPLPVEEVILNSLEMAWKEEEEDRHLRAITQKETDDCILKRVVEISKEERHLREEEERCREEEEERRRQEEETERRLARWMRNGGAGVGLSERSTKRSTGGSRGTTHAAAPAVISSTSD